MSSLPLIVVFLYSDVHVKRARQYTEKKVRELAGGVVGVPAREYAHPTVTVPEGALFVSISMSDCSNYTHCGRGGGSVTAGERLVKQNNFYIASGSK